MIIFQYNEYDRFHKDFKHFVTAINFNSQRQILIKILHVALFSNTDQVSKSL